MRPSLRVCEYVNLSLVRQRGRPRLLPRSAWQQTRCAKRRYKEKTRSNTAKPLEEVVPFYCFQLANSTVITKKIGACFVSWLTLHARSNKMEPSLRTAPPRSAWESSWSVSSTRRGCCHGDIGGSIGRPIVYLLAWGCFTTSLRHPRSSKVWPDRSALPRANALVLLLLFGLRETNQFHTTLFHPRPPP